MEILKRIFGRGNEEEEPMKELTFSFPFYIRVYDPSSHEEDAYTGLSGKSAYEYTDEETRGDVIWDFNESHLAYYFKEGSVMHSAVMDFKEDGTIQITVTLPDKYVSSYQQEIQSWLKGQLSDGWGEHYEGLLYGHPAEIYDSGEQESYEFCFDKPEKTGV